MTRAQLFQLAEALAEFWTHGDHRTVVDAILGHPAPVAASLAVIIAAELDQLFNEGPIFRSALVDRAVVEQIIGAPLAPDATPEEIAAVLKTSSE